MKIIKRFKLSELMNNCYLIKEENNIILIDAPDQITKVIDYLEENNLILNQVFLTHIHYDHIVGLKVLKERYPELKVYASTEEKKLINDPKSNLIGVFGNGNFIYEDEVLDNKTLDNKNLIIKNISGHSKESSVYIFLKEKIMFTGDVLFNKSIGRSDLIYGNQQQLVQGIKEELLPYDDFLVYPGHGFSTTIKDEKQNEFLK